MIDPGSEDAVDPRGKQQFLFPKPMEGTTWNLEFDSDKNIYCRENNSSIQDLFCPFPFSHI